MKCCLPSLKLRFSGTAIGHAVSKGAKTWISNHSGPHSAATVVYNICLPAILGSFCKLGYWGASTLSNESESIALAITFVNAKHY